MRDAIERKGTLCMRLDIGRDLVFGGVAYCEAEILLVFEFCFTGGLSKAAMSAFPKRSSNCALPLRFRFAIADGGARGELCKKGSRKQVAPSAQIESTEGRRDAVVVTTAWDEDGMDKLG